MAYMLHMTKMYVKDSNGRYRLVDRDQKVADSGQKTLSESQALTLEGLAARIKVLERIVIDPRR